MGPYFRTCDYCGRSEDKPCRDKMAAAKCLLAQAEEEEREKAIEEARKGKSYDQGIKAGRAEADTEIMRLRARVAELEDEYDEGWEDGYDAGRRAERENMQPARTETAAEITRLRARVAELEVALAPFGQEYVQPHRDTPDEAHMVVLLDDEQRPDAIRAGDLRRARAALRGEEG